MNNKITIATACRNRESNLRLAIQTWLALRPRNIIICDWGSSTPLTLASLGVEEYSDLVHIFRVDDASRWVLTWAFNEALMRVETEFTIKLDCDHALSVDFLARNNFVAGGFSRGHWRYAAPDQAYVNGAFISCSKLLENVGYYDERITSYGWDDSDLYARLFDASECSSLIASGSVVHMEQSEHQRTSHQSVAVEEALAARLGMKTTEFLILRNRLLCGMLWPWDQNMFRNRIAIRNAFADPEPEQECLIECANLRAFEIHYSWAFPGHEDDVIDLYRKTLYLAGGEHLAKPMALMIPEALERYREACQGNDSIAKNLIRQGLLASSYRRASGTATLDAMDRQVATAAASDWKARDASTSRPSAAASPINHRRRLYVDVQHGLGNRLRTLASAAVIAEASDRELIVVWQPDAHCEARLSDLFDYRLPVQEQSFLADAVSAGMSVYNYMPTELDAVKDQEILLDDYNDLYLRSAFVFNSDATNWKSENLYLQSLQPSQNVLHLVDQVESPSVLSVHIRMAGGQAFEHLPYESRENWSEEDHRLIEQWRSRSNYRFFIARINRLIETEQADTIFLAADLPEVYDIFLDLYPGRIRYLRRGINDRSVEQLQYALADAILLSRSQRLLASTWSSFSELAIRLAPASSLIVEMSGQDF